MKLVVFFIMQRKERQANNERGGDPSRSFGCFWRAAPHKDLLVFLVLWRRDTAEIAHNIDDIIVNVLGNSH
jgi:hypothetical protein